MTTAGEAPAHRGMEPWYRAAEIVVKPPLRLWLNWRVDGLENVPSTGPAILACNHLSYFDALALAYIVELRSRRPRFLAKSELFRNVFLRTVLSGAGQIPVERGTGDPAPLAAAVGELARGELIVIFPEGTTTKLPGFAMQPAKNGAARLSLQTGIPITPAAIWGSHRVWKGKGTVVPGFGRVISVAVGEPVTAEGSSDDPTALRTVSDELMGRIEELRERVIAGYPERWR